MSLSATTTAPIVRVTIDLYNVVTKADVEAWIYQGSFDPTYEDEHTVALHALDDARRQAPAGCDAAVRHIEYPAGVVR